MATATLIAACKNGTVNKDAIVMLNITGGGEEKLKAEKLSLIHIFRAHETELDLVCRLLLEKKKTTNYKKIYIFTNRASINK